MYATAFATLKQNIALYTVVLVFVVMLEMIMYAAGVVTLVFSGLAMLYTHRIIQLRETYGWADPMSTRGADGSRVPIIGYLLRFLALFVVLMLFIAGGFACLDALGFLNPDAYLVEIDYGIWATALGIPAFVGLLGLVGTVLPACAERADKSLGAAYRRARKTFGKTALNLLIGPVAFSIVCYAALGQLGWVIGSLGDGWVPRALFRTVATALTLVPALLAATALSLAYLDAEAR